jgi:hypothetical protein
VRPAVEHSDSTLTGTLILPPNSFLVSLLVCLCFGLLLSGILQSIGDALSYKISYTVSNGDNNTNGDALRHSRRNAIGDARCRFGRKLRYDSGCCPLRASE